jgi:hypothetical protein
MRAIALPNLQSGGERPVITRQQEINLKTKVRLKGLGVPVRVSRLVLILLAHRLFIMTIQKALEIGFSAAKGIPMIAIFLWLSGSGINIFTLFFVFFQAMGPIRALMSINQRELGDAKTRWTWQGIGAFVIAYAAGVSKAEIDDCIIPLSAQHLRISRAAMSKSACCFQS